MLSWIREKFGRVIIGSIVGFIAFVFVFYGVFSPKATRGLHEGAVAGTVNGEAISISEFNRELNRKMELFRGMGGGKLTDEQLKSFGVAENVFQELAQWKLMIQESERQGMSVADQMIKEKIQEIPSFQKDGKFDVATYKEVLEINHQNPSSYEKMVRDVLSQQQWDGYFQSRVHVSEGEVKQEFNISQDKRKVKYVLLTTESAKKKIDISRTEIQKFLADGSKFNLVKMKFEELKKTVYKDIKFEVAQDLIARDILATEKRDEIQKLNSNLADEVLALIKAGSASDGKVNRLLAPYGVQIKSTGLLSRMNFSIPQVGESKELFTDVFAARSPIDEKQGGKAKKYPIAGQILVALTTEDQKPDFSKFEKERGTLVKQISMRKSRELSQEWLKKLVSQAKIETNPAVVSSQQ